ncbi:hypothetical protein GWM83_01065 [Candidatus Bathyarchaeota archaeon]|nr:hypothetical protein [Candidatus Bathyarchaeota archaeon]NIR12563.1 hypothetical protein [Desulfobacterales bacterium]NIV67512.1 hypothetical protein [Candidatus Bathyarchaeota archaeon]NIW34143.1 hypothetical protein [Candidatus Bathyarchaeota archaeon]
MSADWTFKHWCTQTQKLIDAGFEVSSWRNTSSGSWEIKVKHPDHPDAGLDAKGPDKDECLEMIIDVYMGRGLLESPELRRQKALNKAAMDQASEALRKLSDIRDIIRAGDQSGQDPQAMLDSIVEVCE